MKKANTGLFKIHGENNGEKMAILKLEGEPMSLILKVWEKGHLLVNKREIQVLN
jgi:hypothetical protein